MANSRTPPRLLIRFPSNLRVAATGLPGPVGAAWDTVADGLKTGGSTPFHDHPQAVGVTWDVVHPGCRIGSMYRVDTSER
ncbi:hypothetical protein GCM10023205_08900 [Yinghuangia aomiensis]|uniref:Uncharacterized protein n=1 Tax=Yinghuangia aomiensis TaxID=676205 RepID=A0ABP9GXD4_9ACTN